MTYFPLVPRLAAARSDFRSFQNFGSLLAAAHLHREGEATWPPPPSVFPLVTRYYPPAASVTVAVQLEDIVTVT